PHGVKICAEGGVHDHWNFHEYPLFRAVCYLAGLLNLMGMNNAYVPCRLITGTAYTLAVLHN
ncbi:MAG: hypothetical protein J5I98_13300, partial [Phaeodactylibacter sp.]|nr:hypothetical protein [Phaeodactylibacter sp.]